MTDLSIHLRLDAPCILDVALNLWHCVWNIEGTLPPLVHLDNVGSNLPVHVSMWLINHNMHHIKPAMAVHYQLCTEAYALCPEEWPCYSCLPIPFVHLV